MTKYATAAVYLAACVRMALRNYNRPGLATFRAHPRAPLTWQRATLERQLAVFAPSRLHFGTVYVEGRTLSVNVLTASRAYEVGPLNPYHALVRLSYETGFRRVVRRSFARLRREANRIALQ